MWRVQFFSLRFAVIHIAKSLKKASAQPKLVKEYACPNARENADPDKTKISA